MTIQVGPRHSQFSHTVKCTGQVFNIGRSYQNHLVLSDPYVAASQLRLRKTSSNWYIDVLDTVNPVFINGKPLQQLQTQINSGDWLTIGRTVLRFFSDDHPMEDTRKLFFSSWYHTNRWQLLLPIFFLVLVISALALLAEYLQAYSELKWQELLYAVLIVQAMIIAWALVWSVVGRILRHQNQFLIQFTVTTVVFILISIADFLLSPIAYMINNPVFAETIEWIVSFVMLSLLLYLNYSIATNLKRPLRVACIISGAILLLTYGLYHLEEDSFQYHPDYMNDLYPPMFKFRNDIDIDDYLNTYDRVFDSVQIDES